MQYIYKRLVIKTKIIGPDNHSTLKTEIHRRPISEMIGKQLTSIGQMWTDYLQTCAYTYNHFASPALEGLSPFQQILGRP